MHPPLPPPDQRPAETTAATGDQWVIGHGHQRAIVTEVGATLRSFTLGDRDVIQGFGPDEWSHGGRGQILAPWPNRLGGGAYEFGDVSAQAPLNEIERRDSIHGLVRWLPWRMTGRAQNRVSLRCELRPSPAYPFALRLDVEYRLGREGLSVSTDAENIGDADLPFGPRLPSLSRCRNDDGRPGPSPSTGRPTPPRRRPRPADRHGGRRRDRIRPADRPPDRRDPTRHRRLRPRPGR